jgi:hypothetical protein
MSLPGASLRKWAMTPELVKKLDDLISEEHRISLIEADHMTLLQSYGYPGFKRQHRYLQRWRNETALCLRNWLTDNFDYYPTVSVNYTTPSQKPTSFLEAVSAIIEVYEGLYKHYVETSRVAANEGLDDLLQVLQCKIGWISKVLCKYNRDLREVGNVSADKVYLQLRSEKLHEKYRKKEESFKVEY